MVLKFLDDVSQSFFDPSETFVVLIYWGKYCGLSGLRCFIWLTQIFSHLPLLIFSVLISMKAEFLKTFSWFYITNLIDHY